MVHKPGWMPLVCSMHCHRALKKGGQRRDGEPGLCVKSVISTLKTRCAQLKSASDNTLVWAIDAVYSGCLDRKRGFQTWDMSKERREGKEADVRLESLKSVTIKMFPGVSILKWPSCFPPLMTSLFLRCVCVCVRACICLCACTCV